MLSDLIKGLKMATGTGAGGGRIWDWVCRWGWRQKVERKIGAMLTELST
jgi:hypothetical protein